MLLLGKLYSNIGQQSVFGLYFCKSFLYLVYNTDFHCSCHHQCFSLGNVYMLRNVLFGKFKTLFLLVTLSFSRRYVTLGRPLAPLGYRVFCSSSVKMLPLQRILEYYVEINPARSIDKKTIIRRFKSLTSPSASCIQM